MYTTLNYLPLYKKWHSNKGLPEKGMKKYKPFKKDMPRYEPRQIKEKKYREMSPSYIMAKKIRSSAAWRKCRNLAMSLSGGMCLNCYKAPAEEVHHIKEVAKFPALALELENLIPLCLKCHGYMRVRNLRGDDSENHLKFRMKKNIGFESLKELRKNNLKKDGEKCQGQQKAEG